MLRTLVLNSQYLPLSLFPLYTIPAEEAISRYLQGNCQVVEWYDRVIKTPSRDDLKWPSVIANYNSHSFRKDVRLKKESLFYRDHCKCVYCGSDLTVSSLTYDHLKPRAKGGKHVFENVVSCCRDCNQAKGDSEHPKWKPRHAPWKPDFYEMLTIRSKYPITVDDESWVPFLPNWQAEIIVKPMKKAA